MGFDLSSAQPLDTPAAGGFDLSSAQPFDAAPAKSSLSVLDLNPMTSPALGDAALSMATGAAGTVAGGWGAIGAAITKALGITDTDPAEVARQVQEALTIRPQTAGGKAIVSAASVPFEKLAEVGTAAGEKVTDATGSPFLGAAVDTAIQAVPMVLGTKGAGATIAAPIKGAAKTLMQSALKPTLEQLRKGKGDIAATTMLDEGINVTKGGAEELRGRVDSLNQRIQDLVDNSPATIDKQHVGFYVQGVLDKFQKQVNATGDVKAIQKAWDEFLNDPNIPNQISVKQAQEYKQGTYKAIGDKAYGELSTADLEAQKALARGLKEEIARAVPEVRQLNAAESKYLTTLSVLERRLMMDANKNPAGLGWLTTSPEKFALWMVDRSPLFKSLIARMTYSAAEPLEGLARSGSAAAAAGGPATEAERDRLRYIKSLAE